VDRGSQRTGEPRRSRHRSEVLKTLSFEHFECRSGRQRLSRKGRGGSGALFRELAQRETRGELSQAEPMQAERRSAPDGHFTREIVGSLPRRPDKEHLGGGLERLNESRSRFEAPDRARRFENLHRSHTFLSAVVSVNCQKMKPQMNTVQPRRNKKNLTTKDAKNRKGFLRVFVVKQDACAPGRTPSPW